MRAPPTHIYVAFSYKIGWRQEFLTKREAKAFAECSSHAGVLTYKLAESQPVRCRNDRTGQREPSPATGEKTR